MRSASRPTPDPIGRARRRLVRTGAALLPAVALCAVWAARAPGARTVTAPDLTPPQAAPRDESGPPPLDLAAFNAPIWHAPPEPEPETRRVTAAPPPTPPPLRVELIGIVREPDDGETATYRAVLYDPAEDRLLIVGAGDRVGQHTVEAVGPHTVVLGDGRRTQALRLDRTPPDPGAPTRRGGRS